MEEEGGNDPRVQQVDLTEQTEQRLPPAGPDASGQDEVRNWLEDPSFERYLRWDEAQPWYNPLLAQGSRAWVEFDVVEDQAQHGRRSAFLHMDSDAQPGKTRVHGVVQRIRPPRVPRYVSGWYRVEAWQRGASRQYLQVVVIAAQPRNAPSELVRSMATPSMQLAITLAGIQDPPFGLLNRRFEITGPLEPAQGEWTFFEHDLAALFRKHWGEVPTGYEELVVFFEVRYDQREKGSAPARADVYFDNLYVGDATRRQEREPPPNRDESERSSRRRDPIVASGTSSRARHHR